MSTWVRIVIVDYKSGPHLQACIDALKTQTNSNFEVVIVDNNCPEGAAQNLSNLDSRFHVLSSEVNLGFAGGCNFGAQKAQTQWLIMLNPDTVPDPEWLEHLYQAAQTYPDISMFGTTLVSAQSPGLLDGYGDVLSIYGIAWRGGSGAPISVAGDEDLLVFGPCGAAAMYRTNAFNAVGGFDTDFFCYIEDVDIAWRLRLQGSDCVQVRAAICAHVGSVSTADNPSFRYYHTARNSIWMIVKCAPLWMVPLMLSLNLTSHIYLRLRGAYQGSGSVRARGIKDGLKGIPRAWRKRKNRVVSAKPSRNTISPSSIKWLTVSPKYLRSRAIRGRPIATFKKDNN